MCQFWIWVFAFIYSTPPASWLRNKRSTSPRTFDRMFAVYFLIDLKSSSESEVLQYHCKIIFYLPLSLLLLTVCCWICPSVFYFFFFFFFSVSACLPVSDSSCAGIHLAGNSPSWLAVLCLTAEKLRAEESGNGFYLVCLLPFAPNSQLSFWVENSVSLCVFVWLNWLGRVIKARLVRKWYCKET